MIIVSIDPGAGGAIAVLKEDRVLEVLDMPIYKTKRNNKNRSEYDRPELARIFREFKEKAEERQEPLMVYLEEVSVRPTDGRVGVFQFGKGFGILLGIAAALDIAVETVKPSEWKKKIFGLSGQTKDESIQRAKQLYPASAKFLTRKKDHGRAEAILIGDYARRFRGVK